MLLPNFILSQTSDTLIVKVHAPYCSIGELEVEIVDDCFIFACFPYYLRFMLPGSVEDDLENSSYNFNSEEFVYKLKKKHPGEEFKDLDIYPKLLINKHKPSPSRNELLLNGEVDPFRFGFAMRGNKRFTDVAEEFLDMFDIDPTKVRFEDRRITRMVMEQKKFCGHHYLHDFDDEEQDILEIMEATPPWKILNSEILTCGIEEFEFFKKHPKTTISHNTLSPIEETYCMNGLLDILFAYCYDRRTTYFEGTCESAWTISKLSATLCCFDAFEHTKEAMVSAFRRCLAYPLYRNFSLTEIVFEDLKSILQLKKRFVVKCLLDIYDIFFHSGRYILNTLYIIDYIHYVMSSSEDFCVKALHELDKVKIRKSDLGYNLRLLEEFVVPEAALYSTNFDVVSDDSDDSATECED